MWRIKPERISLRGDFFLLPLVSLLIAPPEVLAAVALAAMLHEIGHLTAMACFGVRCRELRLSLFGAEIDAPQLERLSYGWELCVTLAGVVVNVCCAGLFSLGAARFSVPEGYLFAGAQMVLGAFNLLPVRPLDGGRALYLIAAWTFGPFAADAIAVLSSVFVSGAMLAVGVYFSILRGGGAFFAMAAAVLFLLSLRQLGLAKGAVRV